MEFRVLKNSDEENLISLGDFLIDVALLTDADKKGDENLNKVSLMTIHVKRLRIFECACCRNGRRFISFDAFKNSRADLEEERRLFYVAVTRAKISLTLSYSVIDLDGVISIQCEPSRFLEELDPQFIFANIF